jgi:hypothetical protein
MEKNMLADLYMKAVLTVIGSALTMIAINPWISPTKDRRRYD